ncbi:putative inorganic phosphate cotransporter [Battus philenor]|uniref:putative inorganic phosphate cotransporter n=1 Tax=Battus philenor TaxID=42288 RepID=UPI0035D122E5
MNVELFKYKFQGGFDGVITKTKFKIGVRHVQMLYMFLCAVVMGALRGGVGVQLLAVVDSSRRNDTYIQIQDWDRRVQGTILSSFFFGYALMLLPAEMYLKKLGDKFVITSVLLTNGGLSAAMPTIVNRGGWAAMCNAHFLMGMTQACLSPINRALLSEWLPPAERDGFARFIDAGIYLGMIAALPLAGLMTESRLGWELLFYSQAMMTLSMAAIWSLLTAASPDQHQAVGDFEKEFIKEASAGYREKRLQKPWRSILKSRQVWAVACAHAAGNALFIFYLVNVPLYIRTMGFTLKESAQFSMLPFIVLLVIHLTTAPTITWISKTGFLTYVFSATYLRKSVNALGGFPIAIGLMLLPNITVEWIYLRLSVLIGTFGLLGLQYSGFLENIRDFTENYSGVIFVASSTFASMVGATIPLLTGLVLNHDVVCLVIINTPTAGQRDDPYRWRILFCTLGGFYATCNVIYAVIGSSDRPAWDDVGKNKFGYHNSVLAYEGTQEVELLDLDYRNTIKKKHETRA